MNNTSFCRSGTFHEFPKPAAYWDTVPATVVKSSAARKTQIQIILLIAKKTTTRDQKEVKHLTITQRIQ